MAPFGPQGRDIPARNDGPCLRPWCASEAKSSAISGAEQAAEAATLDRIKAARLCEPLLTNVFVDDSRLSCIIYGHRGNGRSHAESHNPHNRGGNNVLTCFYVLGSESE